jgi:hypothetical protein
MQGTAAAPAAGETSEAAAGSSRQQQPTAAAAANNGNQQPDNIKVPAVYAAASEVAKAVMHAVLLHSSSNGAASWQPMLHAAADDALVSLWRILFVYLAWMVGAQRRQVASWATARLAAGKKAAQKALAAVPCYHEQLLAAVGAPVTWEVGPNTELVTHTITALWSVIQGKKTTSVSIGNGSSAGSSSSSATAAAGAQQQLMQQLAGAVPCKQALLLLLEAVLVQLYVQDPSSDAVRTMDNSNLLVFGVLQALEHHSGEAAAAEAASVLLQALVQALPQAVLHAAAAAGCEGLRPHADENVSPLAPRIHCEYAKLINHVAIYAHPSECDQQVSSGPDTWQKPSLKFI